MDIRKPSIKDEKLYFLLFQMRKEAKRFITIPMILTNGIIAI
jgi:hypothetical protein